MSQEAEEDEERLAPFVYMLQFGVEALLLAPGGAPAPAAAATVATMLHTVRRAVDASQPPLTDNMCGACRLMPRR